MAKKSEKTKMGAVEIPPEELPDDMPAEAVAIEPTGEEGVRIEDHASDAPRSFEEELRDPPPLADEAQRDDGASAPPPVDAPREEQAQATPELAQAIDLQGATPSGEGMADASTASAGSKGGQSTKRGAKGKETLTREQRMMAAATLAPLLEKGLALATAAAGSSLTTDRFLAEKIAQRPGWKGGAPFDLDFSKLGPGSDLSEAFVTEYTVWRFPSGERRVLAGRKPPAELNIEWRVVPASLELAIAFNLADGPAQALDKAVEWIEAHEGTVRLVVAAALTAFYGMAVMRDLRSPQVEARPAPAPASSGADATSGT